ncbi:Zn-dependent exopeptidase [Atractiella rhizophila]|nr:Zn-dependent exopeptidase [Atractiella rhizophila]
MHLLSLLSLFAFALAAPTTTSDPTAQYDGVKVLRIPTSTQAFADSLSAIVDKHGVELWTHHFAPNSNVDVQVSPEKYDAFVGEVNALLSSSGYGTGNRKAGILTMHEDLGESIRKESEGSDRPVSNARVGLASPTWFTSYHSYADHLTFLSDLVRTYPNNARLVSTGTSLQGRNITGVQIFGSSGAGVKPAVVWHGTVHAREWIGTMVRIYPILISLLKV